MAVDTANKRYSMMRLGQAVGLLPVPDGTVGTQDRAHLLGLYAGIALDAPAAPVFALLVAAVDIRPVLYAEADARPRVEGRSSL